MGGGGEGTQAPVSGWTCHHTAPSCGCALPPAFPPPETPPNVISLLILPLCTHPARCRYYGESKPFPKETIRDHMDYLTTEQAMADYAALIT